MYGFLAQAIDRSERSSPRSASMTSVDSGSASFSRLIRICFAEYSAASYPKPAVEGTARNSAHIPITTTKVRRSLVSRHAGSLLNTMKVPVAAVCFCWFAATFLLLLANYSPNRGQVIYREGYYVKHIRASKRPVTSRSSGRFRLAPMIFPGASGSIARVPPGPRRRECGVCAAFHRRRQRHRYAAWHC